MSSDSQAAVPLEAAPPTSLHLLVDEAARQLDICNACRYCEGLCAVFPALERRMILTTGDVSQLANLCHDCRACYDACMYTAPHEFDLNVPQALSAVRLADYQRYVWPRTVPKVLSGWAGTVTGAVTGSAIMLTAAVANTGWGGLISSGGAARSAYEVIPYLPLLSLMGAAALFAIIVTVLALRRYWRATTGLASAGLPRAIARATWEAATLRYLRGGGGECYYPADDQPTSARRYLHSLVAYGFGLCVVSTIAASVLQDIFRRSPPFPVLSVPVMSGTIGGIGLVAGCIGLLVLKTQSSRVTSFALMTVKDYGLLVALTFLALTGLAALLTRDTPAFSIVLIIHLGSVIQSFAMAPYSKFLHVGFRYVALVRDSLERQVG